MKYIKYNQEKLSKLSMGTVQFGLDYGIANTSGQPAQEEVNKIIDYIHLNGINCFDTAQDYGNSEAVLGKALKDKHDIYIVSKLKTNLFKQNALQNVSMSLSNLSVKSLYALLLHDSELLYNWTNDDSIIVDELLKSEKIKYFGVSIYTNDDFNLAIENDKIEFIQIPFNLFDKRAITEHWFEKAKEKNKLIFIRSVFLQGLLLMKKENIPKKIESAKIYIEVVEDICEELNISKNELALSFVDTVAKDSLVLFGCDNIEQAKENITTYNLLKKLDDSVLLKIMEKLSDIDESIYNPTRW